LSERLAQHRDETIAGPRPRQCRRVGLAGTGQREGPRTHLIENLGHVVGGTIDGRPGVRGHRVRSAVTRPIDADPGDPARGGHLGIGIEPAAQQTRDSAGNRAIGESWQAVAVNHHADSGVVGAWHRE
jgi:hypothetical protein